MNKTELVKLSAEKGGLTQKDMEVALKAMLEAIKETVANGEKVSLVGFGTFEPRLQKGREGECKIPTAMGKKYKTEDKYVPKFSAGKEFKGKVAERPVEEK